MELAVILKALLVILGGSGFILSHYVWRKKREEVFVCPLNGQCHDVVRSDYSRFFGIPVEKIGMLYYLLVFAGYSYLILYPSLAHPLVLLALFIATTLAFLFSLYLTAVQGFALHQWCTWCLFSAGICTLIFSVGIYLAAVYDFSSTLAAYKGYIVFFHALAAAIGVGAVTMTDIFFFKFLRDRKINETEKSTLSTFSQVLWFALGLLLLTGVGLFLPNSDVLLQSSKFITKMVIVGIILINGVFLNIVITPKLTKIAFSGVEDEERSKFTTYRRLAFLFGPISIVSWYSVFLLGSIRSISLSVGGALLIYLLLLLIASLASQLYGESLLRRKR